MKNLVFILGCLYLFSSGLQAQSNVVLFPNKSESVGTDFYYQSSGKWLVAGKTYGTQYSERQDFILQIDSNGVTDWKFNITGQFDAVNIQRIRPLANGNIVFCGSESVCVPDYFNTLRKEFVCCYSPSGQLLWKNFTGSYTTGLKPMFLEIRPDNQQIILHTAGKLRVLDSNTGTQIQEIGVPNINMTDFSYDPVFQNVWIVGDGSFIRANLNTGTYVYQYDLLPNWDYLKSVCNDPWGNAYAFSQWGYAIQISPLGIWVPAKYEGVFSPFDVFFHDGNLYTVGGSGNNGTTVNLLNLNFQSQSVINFESYGFNPQKIALVAGKYRCAGLEKSNQISFREFDLSGGPLFPHNDVGIEAVEIQELPDLTLSSGQVSLSGGKLLIRLRNAGQVTLEECTLIGNVDNLPNAGECQYKTQVLEHLSGLNLQPGEYQDFIIDTLWAEGMPDYSIHTWNPCFRVVAPNGRTDENPSNNKLCTGWVGTGEANPLSHKIQAFPNPAQDRVFLEFGESLQEPLECRIISAQGNVISTQYFTAGMERAELDTAPWPNGFYVAYLGAQGIKLSILH